MPPQKKVSLKAFDLCRHAYTLPAASRLQEAFPPSRIIKEQEEAEGESVGMMTMRSGLELVCGDSQVNRAASKFE
jgi:hypothetical protein